MRIGINTGEVLVGTLAGSDYTAMGDVVNTASRLQALAPPGGVLVGSATIALCPPSIHCDACPHVRQPAETLLRAAHRRATGRPTSTLLLATDVVAVSCRPVVLPAMDN
jgi:class 3 adenylate cyclase